MDIFHQTIINLFSFIFKCSIVAYNREPAFSEFPKPNGHATLHLFELTNELLSLTLLTPNFLSPNSFSINLTRWMVRWAEKLLVLSCSGPTCLLQLFVVSGLWVILTRMATWLSMNSRWPSTLSNWSWKTTSCQPPCLITSTHPQCKPTSRCEIVLEVLLDPFRAFLTPPRIRQMVVMRSCCLINVYLYDNRLVFSHLFVFAFSPFLICWTKVKILFYMYFHIFIDFVDNLRYKVYMCEVCVLMVLLYAGVKVLPSAFSLNTYVSLIISFFSCPPTIVVFVIWGRFGW